MYEIARCYKTGSSGFPVDAEKAAHWYLRAASCGSIRGIAGAGACFLSGAGVVKDIYHGLILLTRAVVKGSSAAAYTLGTGYLFGDYGLPVDFEQAVKYIEMAMDVNVCRHRCAVKRGVGVGMLEKAYCDAKELVDDGASKWRVKRQLRNAVVDGEDRMRMPYPSVLHGNHIDMSALD